MKPRTATFTNESINFLIDESHIIQDALSCHEDCTSMFYSNSENYRQIIKRMIGRISPKPKIKSIDRKIEKSKHSNIDTVKSITVVVKGIVAEYTIFYETVEYGNIRITMTVGFIDTDDKDSPYLTSGSEHLIA